jgi:DNA-directed RNA polymerase specialized sigma24 family protein
MPDELVARIEQVYRTDYRKYLRVALGVLRDEDRAVDAVQEAFATAVQKRRRYRGEGPLEAWIWRMVVNAALKERGRPQALALVEDVAARSPPEGGAAMDAIARLPERQRLALFLRYYADLDYESIATVLGVTTGTVGATLNAAHTSVRRLLQEVKP